MRIWQSSTECQRSGLNLLRQTSARNGISVGIQKAGLEGVLQINSSSPTLQESAPSTHIPLLFASLTHVIPDPTAVLPGVPARDDRQSLP